MSNDNYDPSAIYKDNIHSPAELDSASAKASLASFPGMDFSRPVGTKHISNEEIKEIAEQCSTPMDSLTPDQKNAIMEYQVRMGVGQSRNGDQRTSSRSYHYFR